MFSSLEPSVRIINLNGASLEGRKRPLDHLFISTDSEISPLLELSLTFYWAMGSSL